jgi:hypothetical protein
MQSLADLNNRINKLFRNSNINFFIIMNIILLITCYTFISTPIKNTISTIISNPIIILFAIIGIIIIGYFDINIAVLLLILFFVALFGIQYNIDTSENDSLEHFENADENASMSKINKNLKIKAENDKKLEERISSIKDVVFGTINKFRNNNDNDYKQAILENKKTMYEKEKENNTIKNGDRSNKNDEDDRDDGNYKNNRHTNKDKFINIPNTKTHTPSNNKNSNNKLSNNSYSKNSSEPNKNTKGRKREEFQTVEPRKFDPSNEEDTNLLITKEILQDMSNRIEYNYENNTYLKKYIKHRVEEIVDINKLIDD